MSKDRDTSFTVGRREFLKTAGAGIAAAGAMTAPEPAAAQALAEKARFDRIASCTWPIRQLFKTRRRPPARQAAPRPRRHQRRFRPFRRIAIGRRPPR